MTYRVCICDLNHFADAPLMKPCGPERSVSMISSRRPHAKSSGLLIEPVLSDYVVEGELAREIEARSIPYNPEPDRTLFRQGDPPTSLYFLKKGEITLTMDSGDQELMRVRAGPGSLIGLPAIVSNEPYSLTARASLDAEIRHIIPEDFHNLLQNRPRLCVDVLKILASETRSVRKALVDFLP